MLADNTETWSQDRCEPLVCAASFRFLSANFNRQDLWRPCVAWICDSWTLEAIHGAYACRKHVQGDICETLSRLPTPSELDSFTICAGRECIHDKYKRFKKSGQVVSSSTCALKLTFDTHLSLARQSIKVKLPERIIVTTCGAKVLFGPQTSSALLPLPSNN